RIQPDAALSPASAGDPGGGARRQAQGRRGPAERARSRPPARHLQGDRAQGDCRSRREVHPRPALGLGHVHRADHAARAGALTRLSRLTHDMTPRGLRPGPTILDRSNGPSSPKESMALGLSPGEPVSRLQRLRLAGGVPMAIEHAVVPARYLPDPGVVDGSLYAALIARGHAPRRALQRLHAVLLSPDQAKLLDVLPASPALYIERRSFLAARQPV